MFLSPISLAVNRPGRRQTLEQAVAALFAAGEQGAWYDPSAANVTWRRNLLTSTDTLPQSAAIKGFRVLGTVPKGVPVVVSFYVKRTLGAGRTFGVDSDNAAPSYGNIDTSTLPLNTWTRVEVTATTVSTASENFVDIASGGLGVVSYTTGKTAPDNTATATEITDGTYTHEFWGAQLERGTTATAYQRIVTPEITYLADVQSQPLLFQDSTGATPVTAVEQPVGLILDKRKGLVLGPELNDSIDVVANWTAFGTNTVAQDGSAIKVTYSNNQNGAYSFLRDASGLSSNLTVGQWYKVTGEAKVNTGSANVSLFATTQSDSAAITSTTYVAWTVYFLCSNATTNYIAFNNLGVGEEIWVRNISVKLLDGNHAYQTTSAARPVLRARYNLLTYSEQLDNAAWTPTASTISANTSDTTDPIGTNTAEKYTNTAASDNITRTAAVTVVAGINYTFSIYAKKGTQDWLRLSGWVDSLGTTIGFNAWFDLANGQTGSIASGAGGTAVSSSIQSAGNGWYRCIVVGRLTSATTLYPVACMTTADNVATRPATSNVVYFWGADLRVGTSAGDYQRIAAATDYATTSTITGQPFRPYIDFDGADFLETATFATPTTSVATVWTGAELRSVGMFRFITEYGPTVSTTDNTFSLVSNATNAPSGIYLPVRGTAVAEAVSANYSPPWTKIITGQFDTTAASAAAATTLRTNGALDEASTTGSAPAGGNWSAQKLYVGRRITSTQYFDGKVWGYILRMAATNTAQVTTGETYMAGKTGVTL